MDENSKVIVFSSMVCVIPVFQVWHVQVDFLSAIYLEM